MERSGVTDPRKARDDAFDLESKMETTDFTDWTDFEEIGRNDLFTQKISEIPSILSVKSVKISAI